MNMQMNEWKCNFLFSIILLLFIWMNTFSLHCEHVVPVGGGNAIFTDSNRHKANEVFQSSSSHVTEPEVDRADYYGLHESSLERTRLVSGRS